MKLDRGLLLSIFTLLGIGLVAVYSASYIFAIERYGNGLHFFGKQLAFVILSFSVLIVVSRLDWKWIEKFGPLVWVASVFLLLLTLVDGISVKAGGASRWLGLPLGLRFEPGELFKLGLCFLLAYFNKNGNEGLPNWQWLLRGALVIFPFFILLKQPDFGTVFISLAVIIGVLFGFGLKWRYVIGAIGVTVPTLAALILSSPYRKARVMAYLDPWSNSSEKGFQMIQSMLSFHSGGITGTGLGQGQSKLFYLPEAHTDFILAVLGEEMGFVGVVLVMALFGFIILRGIQISVRSENVYAKTLALGITLVFSFSVFVNLGVVLGLLPTKGLTLPFISYGGSSLIVTCLSLGLLLNIDRNFGPNSFKKRRKRSKISALRR